jgi:GNAT superfamily N-acetyltransferase
VADWIIEPFGKHHERASFSCGRPALDDFIRALVSQYEKRSLGKTFVATLPGDSRVFGYYTIAAGAIGFEQLPPTAARKLPKHPVPIVLLGRLAVDSSAQGKRLGEGLLLDALQRSLDLSSTLGVYAIEVKALDDAAAAFYRKYGFMALVDNPSHLFLPMSIVERVLR